MENSGSLEKNLNDLSTLMVNLKHTKDQVAIKGKWHMGAWLKNVRDRERQVNEIIKEANEKTAGVFLINMDTADKLNTKLIESLMALKILIEEGNAGSQSIPDHLSSEKYQLKLFSSGDLMKFTDFDKELGVGGFSIVYQGELEGEKVAIKVLKENDMVYETFLSERITMGRISHTNLVKLYGFCFDDDIKALVYEYMENGSLDEILYKNPNNIDWTKLYDIALGIARGLAYLHHDCGEQIIHHDVKAANVLLDKNLCPKITDFGVSKLMRSDVTHLTSSGFRGTDYYAAPENHQPLYPITSKCDVYSFGLMLFEILGRRRHIPKDNIWFPKAVSKMLNEEPQTVMEYCGIMEQDRDKAMIMLMVAMWCAQYTPTIRPSMSEVVEVLEKEMLIATPPYPFQSHNIFSHSMLPSLQGNLEVPEVPVNEHSLAILRCLHQVLYFCYPTPVFEREEDISNGIKKYSRTDLELFTSGFSESNIIGIRGFVKVYKGILNGIEVAIKLFGYNDDFSQELLMTEVRTMSTLYHKNIVTTYGYCFDKKMIALIYEYMPSGSLDKILYGNQRLGMKWERLYGIVIEIAEGLSYLHEDHQYRIIHFDVKPSNILLDNNFSPKIKSFGLAKLMARDVTYVDLTRIRGTPGYNAPETWMPGAAQVTSKADVYSFGMMMFEVLGMRSNIQPGQSFFPQQVWEKFEIEEIEELIEDCGITGEDRKAAKRLTMIALWCIQFTPCKRPSMKTVVNMLEETLPVTRPPYPFVPSLDDDARPAADVHKKEESKSLLLLYDKKCPPGGENSVIIYTTTIERMRRSFKESNYVRKILQSHHIKMIERDVYGDEDDVDYEDELVEVLGKILVPVLFVKGRFIGAADEVKRLEAEDKLKVLLYGIPIGRMK